MRNYLYCFGLIAAISLASSVSIYAQSAAPEPDIESDIAQEAWLGVYVKPVPQALRAQLEIGKSIGLLVEDVVPGSPAEISGLQAFDVLLSFEDQMLFNRDQLHALVLNALPASTVSFEVVRAGKSSKIEVALGSRDAKKGWKAQWEELEIDVNLREMLESITENPEIKSALSEAEGEVAELIRSLSESLPTEDEIRDNIGAALKALTESGAVIKDIEILSDGEQIEVEIEAQEKVMRRSRILSDATEVNYSDRHGKIHVSTHENAKQVLITGENDQVIYEGPLTEEAIQSLGRRDRERLQNLLTMHEIEVPEAG